MTPVRGSLVEFFSGAEFIIEVERGSKRFKPPSGGDPRSSIPGHKLLQPFFDRSLRIVPKQAPGLGNIRPGDRDIARLVRKLLTDGSASGGFLQQFDQFSQPDRMRIPQIEYLESAVSRPRSGHVLD